MSLKKKGGGGDQTLKYLFVYFYIYFDLKCICPPFFFPFALSILTIPCSSIFFACGID